MKKRTEVVEAFDRQLRTALKKRMGFCEACGRARLSIRSAATAAGVSHASLFRFVNGGEPGNELADKVTAWLERGQG